MFLSIGEFGQGFNIETIEQTSHDERWQQPWGEREWIRDHHNRLKVKLSNAKYRFYLEFNAFDDGISFRYSVPSKQVLIS